MCWKPEYIILILLSTLIDYYSGIKIETSKGIREKKFFLLISLFSNLGILFGFKYLSFFNESVRNAFVYFNIFYDVPVFDILLPIGISFYTFQTLSYSISVYKQEHKAERNFIAFALYVSFFPQLVAGPIERSTKLLPQFKNKFDFDYERVTNGIKLMLWGFFKKVVIADRLAILVNQVYNNPEDYTGIPLIIATYFFAFQIYCDFSGYSDIAIGSAQVLGYKLNDNFNRPYFSKNISEFWKRWHISLSTWFRDYLYIPLGGNKVSKNRWLMNLFIVFFVSGLWHGANWTFVVWGALHGFYLIFSILSADFRKKIQALLRLSKDSKFLRFFKVFFTFHLVLFAWIFFRANNVSDAFYIISNLFNFANFSEFMLKMSMIGGTESCLGMSKLQLLLSFLLIIFMESIHLFQRHKKMRNFLSEKPVFLRWSIYYVLIFAILILGEFSSSDFIYFQF